MNGRATAAVFLTAVIATIATAGLMGGMARAVSGDQSPIRQVARQQMSPSELLAAKSTAI